MTASNDLVLLSSFLQNQQQEKNNETLRNIHQILTGKSLLTQKLELSPSELKEQQLSDLKLLWQDTPYPAQTIGHMARIHSAYTDELLQQENIRLIQCSEFIRDEKANSATPQDVTAESLGLNTSRRPPKRLPLHL